MPEGISTTHGEGNGLKVYYFANCIKVMRGRELITFSRIRSGAPVIGLTASCCGALMTVESPRYNGKIVGVYPEFRPLENVSLRPLTTRVHINDFPRERLAMLPPKPGMFRDEAGAVQIRPLDDPLMLRAMRAFAMVTETPMTDETETRGGESFAELIASIADGVVTTLEIPEGKNSARLTGRR